MKRLSPSATITLIALAAAALTGCGSKSVVGVLLPTTGAAASYGESMKRGIELAVQQGQADGSLSPLVRWIWGDSGSDPVKAAAELERLAREGAHIVIVGTTSDEAKALLPALEKLNVVALSPSASAPGLTKDSRMFFRVFASDELEGRRAGRFLREEQDDATVLIYAEDSEQARGIEPPFRQVFEQAMEGRVVGRVSLSDPAWQQESADLLAANNPDAVYIVGYADSTLKAVRHLRERSYPGTICLTSAFYSGKVVESEPKLLEGVFFPQPAFDMKDERELVQSFVTSYQKRLRPPAGHLRCPRLRRRANRRPRREAVAVVRDLRAPQDPHVLGQGVSRSHRPHPVRRARRRQAQPDHVHHPRWRGAQLRALCQGPEEGDPRAHQGPPAAR